MRLLIIGDSNKEIQEAIDIAKLQKAKISMVSSIVEGVAFLCEGKGADLVLIDVKADIKLLIESMNMQKISTPVVAYGIDCSPKEAVFAIKSGARELIPLPPNEKLIAAIFASIANESSMIIGSSKAIKDAINIANRVASSDANILITGQSGTGKEIFARYIHNNSKRKDKSFVSVNCAAIPDNLLESELFGHEKGAFTGALVRRIGKFEESSGGTLLLDEVSEMEPRLQAKLLRAIQEKEIDRVGGGSPVKVDLRIIATSNRNLAQEITKGNFREDLYFRLNIINLELPALKDRHDDILLLSNFFIEKYVESNKLPPKDLSSKAIEKMNQYSWPGNVRELENIIHRAVLLCESDIIQDTDIQVKNTPVAAHSSNTDSSFSDKNILLSTLGYCLGDLNKTANILGVSIGVLKERLEDFARKTEV